MADHFRERHGCQQECRESHSPTRGPQCADETHERANGEAIPGPCPSSTEGEDVTTEPGGGKRGATASGYERDPTQSSEKASPLPWDQTCTSGHREPCSGE